MAGNMNQFGGIIKLFVSNLPDGCTPWELRKCLEAFGDIVGTYVARKRDKNGCRFGFASFKAVRDKSEFLKSLGGVRMGDFKLKINVARFAAENHGGQGDQPAKKHEARAGGNQAFNGGNHLRDSRSYRDVVGKSDVIGSSSFRAGTEEGSRFKEKLIVVPDRTGAFNDLFGLALVGRTVDIETLVDFDKLLRIAKISVTNLQYLGGLSLLISFSDAVSAKSFMDAKEVWGPWFSKLDFWSGQTLPLERVAWLKLCGIPLHLLDPVVLGLVGESFGKVLHVPKLHEEDLDLSTVRVGVLVGSSGRIKEEVSLKWKDRSFRIWVEEDSDVWVPDCLDRDDDSESEEVPSPEFSPVVDMAAGSGEMEGMQSSEFGVPDVESPINDGPIPHLFNSPSRVEREKVADNIFENVEVGAGINVSGRLGSSLVGPGGNGGFNVGTGSSGPE
ncbi:putative RNA recognition motif domain, nucleotide-binding alpha-beta plait domain superfamily [Helianthus annuus]|uniref:RNA recognition motif domain, nucleotide-binding alpha-beta plait domain superfamily n=1 Tax=Helianthus annuus TaxID=4232 RepID=A0A9K3DYY5_HELAN|nr:putative RNA recognition motif domain, nucleotide-binding alpha-beta plait domain superfamily [Helianthus annuus]KAJ0450799.1 putative RNA recognition motif domain, nucleotide-binding alpha-beta plait domain superfamily [Helianthus annuus]KAJ0472659.1 putative RNA recognition motif domain, nucleotide-binding alpha-beta plait domain superfamily [Helianthus annuus]KAJ0648261.1 putative RNA recognition motif domain, nucleotide-binding alpha-beta plait domain superfamily [Helianthus annuus]KAJ06